MNVNILKEVKAKSPDYETANPNAPQSAVASKPFDSINQAMAVILSAADYFTIT